MWPRGSSTVAETEAKAMKIVIPMTAAQKDHAE